MQTKHWRLLGGLAVLVVSVLLFLLHTLWMTLYFTQSALLEAVEIQALLDAERDFRNGKMGSVPRELLQAGPAIELADHKVLSKQHKSIFTPWHFAFLVPGALHAEEVLEIYRQRYEATMEHQKTKQGSGVKPKKGGAEGAGTKIAK